MLVGNRISNQIFKNGGLAGSEFLEGGCWKAGANFFNRGQGLQFLHKK